MKTSLVPRLAFLTAVTASVACEGGGDVSNLPPAAASGIDPSAMDMTVQAGEDIYRLVNGQWLETTEIPADRASWGAFAERAEVAEAQLRALVEEAAALSAVPEEQAVLPDSGHPPLEGTEARKVGDLYASWMDEATIEERGLSPLEPTLARVRALASHEALPALFAELSTLGVTVPAAAFVSLDPGQPDRYVAFVFQSGLGLPNRDFYLSDDTRFREIRTAYQGHIEGMFAEAGLDDAPSRARGVLALEARLAAEHWTPVQSRDAEATYNPMDVDALQSRSPLDWMAFLEGLGVAGSPVLVVQQPSYLEALPGIVRDTSLEEWRSYLFWQVLNACAPYLSSGFAERDFRFFGTTLNGIEEQRERWKRGNSHVNEAMGEGLGKLYVERHFPPEARERMETLVDNLIAAMGNRLRGLEWMGEETRQKALAKLDRFNAKIGYPDRWRDYGGLEVVRGDLVGNVMRSRIYEREFNAGRLGGPIDRDEWMLPPQTVNAYYMPTMNEVVLPAAILHPPFFNLAADDAVNYGAIGAVIGHEITHGFDDQGSRFDGDGTLRNWWTDEDRAAFEALTARLVEQYDGYCPLEGHCVQGALSLGENLADLGGVTVAYDAWRLSLGDRESPQIDGFSGAQRFFMGWAQVWRTRYREEALINQLRTGPHSPAEYRVNGTLVSIPAFHEAFGIQEGDPMWKAPEDRIRIW